MQLDDIEVFLTLDKTQSLSQAAEQLYMSRPGLSQRLANIEQRYGRQMYQRTSTGLVPTAAGQIVTKYAREISKLETALASELAASDEHFGSSLEIGMSPADGVELLPKLVASFHALHPDALIHLESGYEPDLINQLRDCKLDLAILENQPVDDEIDSVDLGYGVLDFVAPDRAPYNTVPQPVKIKTLLEWPMIIYEWNSGRHMVGNRHFRERYGISLNEHNMVAQFDTHEALVNGVKAGLGWGCLPRSVARRYRNEPGLLWFKADTDPMLYPVSLAWKRDRMISPLADEFKRHVLANIPQGYFR